MSPPMDGFYPSPFLPFVLLVLCQTSNEQLRPCYTPPLSFIPLVQSTFVAFVKSLVTQNTILTLH